MKIYLIGFMGCGKSHWGRLLGEKLKIPFMDLDDRITAAAGKNITEIFAEEGEERFRALERDTLHQLSEGTDSFIMACGGGTPCFYNNIGYMNRTGTTVWIHCSVDCLFGRLQGEKAKRPLIRDLSDEALKSYIQKKFSDRRIFYEQASVQVPGDELTLDRLVDVIFHS
ncbi:MAG TPA: shikimate kinase [Chitinophagaceae bacterium]|jgi:shikimate kinase|nr:shikimate kinase [Chitinophagaceae bacterium]